MHWLLFSTRCSAQSESSLYLPCLLLAPLACRVAPEVLMGGRQCTQAVDLYSFGVVLWEIVTGERPQRGSLRPPRVPEECPQVGSLQLAAVDGNHCRAVPSSRLSGIFKGCSSAAGPANGCSL